MTLKGPRAVVLSNPLIKPTSEMVSQGVVVTLVVILSLFTYIGFGVYKITFTREPFSQLKNCQIAKAPFIQRGI